MKHKIFPFKPLIDLFFKNKIFLSICMFMSISPLHAGIDNVAEPPNFITFIRKAFFEGELSRHIQHWEPLFFSIAIATVISLIFHYGSKNSQLIPSGLQNFLEMLVETIRNFILSILGKRGDKYIPFLGTLFIYILSMNWLVLFPLMKPPSSDINVTIALALCVFVLVQYLNFKNYGFLGFFHHLAGHPKTLSGWLFAPFMFLLEIFTQISRPITLSLRLFGNVVGEDILIGVFSVFGVYMLSGLNLPIGFPLQLPFVFLAILTGFMQALVFTLLSTIYILLSFPDADMHE